MNSSFFNEEGKKKLSLLQRTLSKKVKERDSNYIVEIKLWNFLLNGEAVTQYICAIVNKENKTQGETWAIFKNHPEDVVRAQRIYFH